MKIQPIIQSSLYINKLNTITKPLFNYAISDCFEKSVEARLLEKIYNKVSRQILTFTPANLNSILQKYHCYEQRDVLMVMNKLSSFANTKKITDFRNWLQIHNINYIADFSSLYMTDPKYAKDDFTQVSGILPENHKVHTNSIKQGISLNLNTIFSYFYNSRHGLIGKCPLPYGETGAIILDSDTIKLLENVKQNNPVCFDDIKNKYKFIYLKDFENSYNIFEQYKDFSKITGENLAVLYSAKKKYPEYATEKLLDLIFNRENLTKIKRLGINPLIADMNPAKSYKIEDINSNLSSVKPDKNAFFDSVTRCLSTYCFNQTERLKLLNYINNNVQIYSFKTISEKLVKLKELIVNKVTKAGRDPEKIYYNVVKPAKSFSLINYMYQKANNISPSRFLYWSYPRGDFKNSVSYKSLNEQLPQGATVVMLDDAIISGESILSSQFNYKPSRDKNSFDIIFASVYSTNEAKEKFDSYKGKTNNDKLVSVDYQLLNKLPVEIKNKEPYKNTFIMFPYNSPDNNSAIFQDTCRLFYPAKSFIQGPWFY